MSCIEWRQKQNQKVIGNRHRSFSKFCSCVICGAEWCSWSAHANQRKTCGPVCASEYKRLERITRDDAKPWLDCQYCNKRFRASRTIGHKYSGKYCSRECAFAADSKAKHERLERIERERRLAKLALRRKCIICEKVFDAARPQRVTCSAKCYYKATYQTVEGQAVHCIVCSKEFAKIAKQGRQSVCSSACRAQLIQAQRLQAKAKRRGCRKVSKVLQAAIWERDRGLCGLCGVPVKRQAKVNDPLALEYDHIIPIARGGAHCAENLQLACRACNAWKSDKDLNIGGLMSETT